LAENLHITKGSSRKELYLEIIPQISALTADEPDLIANLANVTAVLKEAFDFLWIGFYLVKGEELVLGPFQGPVACTRIKFGHGVCGQSWKNKASIIVPDVDQFPGHIACSSFSKSEIVIPAFKKNQVQLILDIDSDQVDDFSELDEKHLSQIVKLIEKSIP